MQQPLFQPEIPPVARLRSFHPVLLALSWILIVTGVGALIALAVVWAHSRRAGLMIVLLPAGIYGAARVFLPHELTADLDVIRWKEPFRSAQVVRRRDIAGIRQRVKRNSSYAYFVDHDGREQLRVGPSFTPAQMGAFAVAVGLPIEDVTAEPPRSPQIDVLDQRSAAQGNRSYGIVFIGVFTLMAWSLWGLVTYAAVTSMQSLDAYNRAPQCTIQPAKPQACRYLTTLTATRVSIYSTGEYVWLAAPPGTVGPQPIWIPASPNDPKPAIEAGSTVRPRSGMATS